MQEAFADTVPYTALVRGASLRSGYVCAEPLYAMDDRRPQRPGLGT